MKTYITDFTYKKQQISLTHFDDHIGTIISNTKNFYEYPMLNYIDKNIKKQDLWIDVGANIGTHTVFFAKFCADFVYSFEPIPENVKILKENIENNLLINKVKLFPVGISKDGRELKGNTVSDNMGSSYLSEGKGIQTINPIDLSFDMRVRVLKIDVENMSLEVLKAFLPIIKQHRPNIFIEASVDELKKINHILPKYKNIGKFNATPTYHLRYKP